MGDNTKAKNIESLNRAIERVRYLLDNYSSDEVQRISKSSHGYYDKNKFIVSFGLVEKKKIGFQSVPHTSEYSIQSCHGMYRSISGFSFIHANVGLFHEKQLKGFKTLKHSLIEFGILILKKKRSKEELKDFIMKYAIPYNAEINKKAP